MTIEKERYGEVEEQAAILQKVFKDGLYREVTPELEVSKRRSKNIQITGEKTVRKRNWQVQRH